MSDRIMGFVGLILSGLYIWAALLIPESFMADMIGPATFPIIIAIAMGLAAIVMIVRPDMAPQWPGVSRLVDIGAALLVMVLYASLLPELGFIIATALASAYLTWRLGTAPLMSVLTGICTALGIYAVFHLALGLSLATGPFGF
ncbi:tripartite tricarboxylate transporter TctB family protein [Paracoccus sp. M683]|uniref:tripartite tricarboxylate transporter TctB family protein n=1 Tax=Paracoccus sp. M683 TaxID=2594268 RepID=UPI00117CC7DE|nr:tripartite tricarboxylate transporter TctB family protein [Paracoccus sp. M683]TRW97845.1 tripartite tricarboxylate transporter TctB family protein [Paracoccus sp. M683]